jgi:hypothetical protein
MHCSSTAAFRAYEDEGPRHVAETWLYPSKEERKISSSQSATHTSASALPLPTRPKIVPPKNFWLQDINTYARGTKGPRSPRFVKPLASLQVPNSSLPLMESCNGGLQDQGVSGC